MPKRSPKQVEVEDDDGRIWPVKRQTPYDRRFLELRDLEAKRDAVMADPEHPEHAKRLALLAPLLTRAKERFDLEAKRGLNDLWRRRRAIEVWRADEGREAYNASRRTVRDRPNSDLSGMDPAGKEQHERDRRSDANWRARRLKAGATPEAVEAAFQTRLAERVATRAQKIEGGQDQAAMEADPIQCMF